MLQEFNKKERGFTLIEVTVSLTILVVVLVLSMTLLWSMQGFAKRQKQFAEPRQTARRAMDYVASNLRAATDGNFDGGNPNAIVAYAKIDDVDTQSTYNNVQDPTLAEPNTDIITFGSSQGGGRILISKWPGHQSAEATAWFYFKDGCPPDDPAGNDTLNMLKFMQATGCSGADCCYTGDSPCSSQHGEPLSAVLTVMDANGNWSYMQITKYQQSKCDQDPDQIHVVMNPNNGSINPPGQKPFGCEEYDGTNANRACKLGKNVSYISLRVLRDQNGIPQLQQKNGIFDPNRDNPGNNFTPLLDNIEDLQIAYIFNDGTIWNDSPLHQLATPGNVPTQDPQNPGQYEITNVVGLRISVTGIANEPVSFAEKARFFRPASEDRPAQWEPGDSMDQCDRFYHYRLTETVMLRNRNLGG